MRNFRGGSQLLLAPVPSSQMWAAHSRPPPLGSGAGYPRAPVRGAAAYLDFCAFPASASGCGVGPCCSVLSLSELFPRMGGSRQSRAIPPYALQEQEQKLDYRCYFFDVRRLPIERRFVFLILLARPGAPSSPRLGPPWNSWPKRAPGVIRGLALESDSFGRFSSTLYRRMFCLGFGIRGPLLAPNNQTQG